jgi:tetratricopeptide (TPR) repeat protein
MNRRTPVPAKRRFQLVQGDGPQHARETEQLDRFLIAPDPLLVASLRQEEQELRRRKLSRGLAVLLALTAAAPFLWRPGPPHAPAALAGKSPTGSSTNLSTSLSTHHERARRLLEEGRKLASAGRDEEAFESFRQAVHLAPDVAETWAALGGAQLRNYQSELAGKDFQRALALEPGNRAALHGLGNLYLRRGEPRKAEAVYLRGGLDQQLARVYLLEGRFQEAEARLAPLLSESSDELVHRMAQAARSRYLEPALRSLLEPEPTGMSPWADLGWRLSRQKRYAEASSAFGRAVAEFPQDVNALSGLGSSLLATNRTAEAKAYFERALSLNDDHIRSLDGLARCLKSEGRVGDAIAVWRRLAELYPGFNDSTPGLAWTYYEIRNYRQAAFYLAQLVKKNPEDARVIDALSVAVQNIGLTPALSSAPSN